MLSARRVSSHTNRQLTWSQLGSIHSSAPFSEVKYSHTLAFYYLYLFLVEFTSVGTYFIHLFIFSLFSLMSAALHSYTHVTPSLGRRRHNDAQRFRSASIMVLKFIMEDLFGMERNLLKRGSDVVALLSRSGPLDRILRGAPVVRAVGLPHGGPDHLQPRVLAGAQRIVRPPRRNGIMRLQLVVLVKPPVAGVIVHKDGRVPAAIQPARASVETLG